VLCCVRWSSSLPIPEKYNVFNRDNTEIKYVNESFNKFKNANEIKKLCEENVQRYCISIGCDYFSIYFPIGKALDIEWELCIWVLNVNSLI
jgi:hypothetical protein